MASIALSNFVRLEESSTHGAPSNRASESRHPPDPAPTAVELDSMSIGAQTRYNGPARSAPVAQANVPGSNPRSTAKEDRTVDPDISSQERGPSSVSASQAEVVVSRSQSPTASASTARETWRNPAINKWRVASACLVTFANGFNDSAPGALLPYIEEYYHIKYAVVSIIFITNAIGFLAAAFVVQALDKRLGRATTLIISELFTGLGFVMMLIPPPYAVFTIG